MKLGLAERNQLLLDMQRHLLNHEVTNRLLEANVQRKELELQYYKERDHTGVIKRSNTFTGSDLNQRPVSSHTGMPSVRIIFVSNPDMS